MCRREQTGSLRAREGFLCAVTTLPQPLAFHRVLIVEDEPLIRWCTAGMVEDAGYAVVEAEDADVAMRILEEQSDIDCIFTDVDMPGSMDGLALVRAVRARWPSIAIIVASGKRTPADDQLPPGARFLPKPYRASDIMAALIKLAPSQTPPPPGGQVRPLVISPRI